MKAKVYEKTLPPLPIYPSTASVGLNQIGISRSEGYPFDEIFVVKSGSGILNIEGKSYTLQENDMFYLHANVPHEYYPIEGEFVTEFLSFFGSSVDIIRNYYNLENYGVYKQKSSGSFKSELLKLFNNFDSVHEASTLSEMTYSAVIAFFDEACRKDYTPIEKVHSFLNANYAKPISLDDILSFYPYSRTKLCTDYKKEYGVTLFDALTTIRLNHAQLILRSKPYLQLKNIAEASGFGDVSYFCKIYKKKYGHSPKSSL